MSKILKGQVNWFLTAALIWSSLYSFRLKIKLYCQLFETDVWYYRVFFKAVWEKNKYIRTKWIWYIKYMFKIEHKLHIMIALLKCTG